MRAPQLLFVIGAILAVCAGAATPPAWSAPARGSAVERPTPSGGAPTVERVPAATESADPAARSTAPSAAWLGLAVGVASPRPGSPGRMLVNRC